MSNAPAAGQALDILELLARHAEPLPAVSIARAVGLPRSSTYHLLAVLVDRGYVTHLPEERRYGLGVAAYEIGSAYQRQAPLQRVARPVVQRLVDETTHNAHVATLHGRDVLYLIEERAAGRPFLVTDVGVRLPAPLTASGLAMLAALPPAQVRALFPHRDALVVRQGGPTSTTQLRRLLTDVRTRGHAVEVDTVTPGLSSVAHAVLDHTGHPVASVAITYPTTDVRSAEVESLVAASRRAAQVISSRLGARPPSSAVPVSPRPTGRSVAASGAATWRPPTGPSPGQPR